jgi:hypothetical protein
MSLIRLYIAVLFPVASLPLPLQAIEEGGSECSTPSSSASKCVLVASYLLFISGLNVCDACCSSPSKEPSARAAQPDMLAPSQDIAAAGRQQETTLQPQPAARNDQQIVDDLQRDADLQYQQQQQDVVSAAMQAMGALPPNAVFKVAAVCQCSAQFS